MKYSEIEKIIEHYKHGNMKKIAIFANFYINEWQEDFKKASETKGTMSGKFNEEVYLLGEAVEFEEKYFSLFANYMSTTDRQNHLTFYARCVRKLYNMTMGIEIIKDAKKMLLNSIKEVRFSRAELDKIVKRLSSYKKELIENWTLDEKILFAEKGFFVRNKKRKNNILEK